jgi:hypothetical protein
MNDAREAHCLSRARWVLRREPLGNRRFYFTKSVKNCYTALTKRTNPDSAEPPLSKVKGEVG